MQMWAVCTNIHSRVSAVTCIVAGSGMVARINKLILLYLYFWQSTLVRIAGEHPLHRQHLSICPRAGRLPSIALPPPLSCPAEAWLPISEELQEPTGPVASVCSLGQLQLMQEAPFVVPILSASVTIQTRRLPSPRYEKLQARVWMSSGLEVPCLCASGNTASVSQLPDLVMVKFSLYVSYPSL